MLAGVTIVDPASTFIEPGVEIEADAIAFWNRLKIEMPLQAYFRINAENMGQFERTLIIVDEGASVHYVEGCTAPVYSSDSLHSAVVEIIVKKGGRCRYTTIQNWSNNVYNLVTKRAVAYENATMEWVDGNLGSKLTMKYPAIWLLGEGAHGEVLSIAFAGEGQHLRPALDELEHRLGEDRHLDRALQVLELEHRHRIALVLTGVAMLMAVASKMP